MMHKRPRFNPEITRVELNPEQAVLVCVCFEPGFYWVPGAPRGTTKDFACQKQGDPRRNVAGVGSNWRSGATSS